MRLVVSIVVFVFVSVTVAGIFLTLALSMPELGFADLSTVGWTVGAGFIVAAPISYLIAGKMLGKTITS
ncbi:MAG: hypothetical protein OQJ97_08755 [Rhodospirillales bacterium]|nr:hypothetical protein [Rhodospirillales bacterium]